MVNDSDGGRARGLFVLTASSLAVAATNSPFLCCRLLSLSFVSLVDLTVDHGVRPSRRVASLVPRRRDQGVLPPGPPQAQAMGPEETWGLIARLTSTLVQELEPERLSEVQRGLAEVASRVTATTDLEMVVPELIDLLGGDGKALRALKMVSQ